MNETLTGLGTFPIGINATGFYTINGTLTVPTIGEGAVSDSQVVVTMNKNGGSAFYTGLAGAEGFYSGISASSGDTINIILSSSAPVDQGLNVIKTTVSIHM